MRSGASAISPRFGLLQLERLGEDIGLGGDSNVADNTEDVELVDDGEEEDGDITRSSLVTTFIFYDLGINLTKLFNSALASDLSKIYIRLIN